MLMALLMPILALSQGAKSLGDVFDEMWGGSIINWPEAEYLLTADDGEVFFEMKQANKVIFGTIPTPALLGRFRGGNLVGLTWLVDPNYSSKVIARASEIYGQPKITTVFPDGINRGYEWRDGNTRLYIILGTNEPTVYIEPIPVGSN